MANQNDSFIDEVTDELRRDRLFATFRRYGWIGALVILAIVGGAAWREYSAAQARAKAQGFGDAVTAALEGDKPSEGLALVAAEGTAPQKAVAGLLAAGAETEAGDSAAAAAQLAAVAEALPAEEQVLRDLARLKLVMVQGETMEPAARDAILADLARAGAPFELLALEQQAVALVGAGRTEDAVTLIRQIQQRNGLSEGLRRRLSEMMIALGVEADPAAAQTAPAMN